MATFNVDIHGVRMNELEITGRASEEGSAWWITLEFGTRDTITLFFATEDDFKEMIKLLKPTEQNLKEVEVPPEEEIPF
jgi:hypothetical protein